MEIKIYIYIIENIYWKYYRENIQLKNSVQPPLPSQIFKCDPHGAQLSPSIDLHTQRQVLEFSPTKTQKHKSRAQPVVAMKIKLLSIICNLFFCKLPQTDRVQLQTILNPISFLDRNTRTHFACFRLSASSYFQQENVCNKTQTGVRLHTYQERTGSSDLRYVCSLEESYSHSCFILPFLNCIKVETLMANSLWS